MEHVAGAHDPRITMKPWTVTQAQQLKHLNRKRRVFVLEDLNEGSELGVNENNINTLEACLTGRLFKMYKNGKYYDPLPYKNCKSFEKQFHQLKHLLGNDYVRQSRIDTVNSYCGRKFSLYMNAMRSLEVKPLTRKDGYSNFFMKMEKINTTKIPRCIQPRNVRYHLDLARYLKPQETHIYRTLKRMFGYDVVAKHKNVYQVAEMFVEARDCFIDPVFIGIDAAKFDMHVTKEVLALEHSIYLHMYKQDPELAKLLSWQVHNRGFASTYDGQLEFEIEGTRFSGDINTSLGNVIIMVLMINSYFRKINYRLINNGDDAYVICERTELKYVQKFPEFAINCGFRIEMEEPVYKMEHVRFCQMAPINVGDGKFVMVRDPKNSMQKDIMSFHDLRNKDVREKWMYAVGYGGLAMTGNIPVLRNFYNYYYRVGNPNSKMLVGDREVANSAYTYWGKGLLPEYRTVREETRVSYFEAFDVTPDEQLKWEKHYNSLSSSFQMDATCT